MASAPFQIEFLRSAQRELTSLSREAQRRISRAIENLRREPCPPGSRAIQGQEGLMRIRVGDYRIIYRVTAPALAILVIRIAHRRTAYARLSDVARRLSR